MKHISLIKAVVLSSALAVASGTAMAGSQDKMKMTYDAAVGAATAELDKAKAVGFEWRDSRKFLKKAAEKAGAGDYEAAMKLVAKAHDQGILAQKQAKDQADPQFRF